MYRLEQAKWRLTLIGILVGALLPLYPASSALANQDKNGNGKQTQHNNNQKQNQQNKQIKQNGDHKQFDHRRFDSQSDNHWRHDRSNDGNWSKYRTKNYRYHNNGKWYRQPQQTRVVYVFVPQHRERMRDYFVSHRSDLPRYYYDDYYDTLPYGTRRNLVVNGYFPQSLEDRLYPFPSELNRWLGPTPYGTRRVMFGRDAYLLQDRTNLILDIIQGLARR